jgi:hypothetical protein
VKNPDPHFADTKILIRFFFLSLSFNLVGK